MVTFNFAGYLSTQQFDRTAVKLGDDYLARICASYFGCGFRLNVSRLYLTQEKVEGVFNIRLAIPQSVAFR